MLRTEWKACLQALAHTPEKLVQLTSGLTDAEVHWKNAGAFSVLENICHLRDIEIEGYSARLSKTLIETHPFLPDIDGGSLAIVRDYNTQDLELALRSFTDARKSNIQTVGRVTMEKLGLEATLEGVGIVTLRKLLCMMREHDEDHIRQLRNIRARLKAHIS